MCRDSILQATSSFELSSITVGGSSGEASSCCSEGWGSTSGCSEGWGSTSGCSEGSAAAVAVSATACACFRLISILPPFFPIKDNSKIIQ